MLGLLIAFGWGTPIAAQQCGAPNGDGIYICKKHQPQTAQQPAAPSSNTPSGGGTTQQPEEGNQRTQGATQTQGAAQPGSSSLQQTQQPLQGSQQQNGTQPSPSRQTQGQPGSSRQAQGQGSLTERVLERNLGTQGFQQLVQRIDSMTNSAGGGAGMGAPAANTWFDVARPLTSNGETISPSGSPLFQVHGSATPPTVQDAQATTGLYHGIPGGVVLEGVAAGLGPMNTLRYNPRFNAFILNENTVYFPAVPPEAVAVLCHAIESDDKERVGVSLGKVQLVYGTVPQDSDLAWDLKMADHFLGDIVFAWRDWSAGYNFPDGFIPEPNRGQISNIAVFFSFNDFQFTVDQQEARLTDASVNVHIYPLIASSNADGNLIPDVNAIAQGRTPSEQFAANAKHIADHITYYRKERIVDHVLAYGALAAFLRAAKQADFDLDAIAAAIPRESAPSPSDSAVPPVPEVALAKHWIAYLKSIQTDNAYSNWSGPPYDLVLNRLKSAGSTNSTNRVRNLGDADLAFDGSRPVLRFAVSHIHGTMGFTMSSCSGYLYISADTIRYDVAGPDKFKDHSFTHDRSDIANVSVHGYFGIKWIAIQLKDGSTYSFLHVAREYADGGRGGTSLRWKDCLSVDDMWLALENFNAALDRMQKSQ